LDARKALFEKIQAESINSGGMDGIMPIRPI
jgi:hypothetical protein